MISRAFARFSLKRRPRNDTRNSKDYVKETQKTTLARTLVGKVVSNKMQKTVTVLVERKEMHPLYGKFVLVSKKYHAHCESNDLNEGDTVEISETRPISKTKAWTVTKVIKKAEII